MAKARPSSYLEQISEETDLIMDQVTSAKHSGDPWQMIKAQELLVEYELKQGFISTILEESLSPLLALYFQNHLNYKREPWLDKIFLAIRRERLSGAYAGNPSVDYVNLSKLYFTSHQLNKAEECLLFAYQVYEPERKYGCPNPQGLWEEIIARLYAVQEQRQKNLDALIFAGGKLSQEQEDEKLKHLENATKYGSHLLFDPIESTSTYWNLLPTLHQKLEKEVKDVGMGTCFGLWRMKRDLLLKKDIRWRSPALMNPTIHFD